MATLTLAKSRRRGDTRIDEDVTVNLRATCTGALLLAAVSQAWADDAERLAMGRVRLSTETIASRGCTHLGRVSDDSVKDLRRKVVRVGGNTAILSFNADDLSTIHAEVFRCTAAAATPTAPKTPPSIPPPPPGSPPPPPPGPSR